MNKMQHDNEVCANCGLTYEGHISNTGCLHPCWKASGTFKATPPAPEKWDRMEEVKPDGGGTAYQTVEVHPPEAQGGIRRRYARRIRI